MNTLKSILKTISQIWPLFRRSRKNTPKMYVLVRMDLSNSYRSAQAIHAVSLYALAHTEQFHCWNNGTVIILGVHNLIELRYWCSKLRENKKLYSVFLEPDLDIQETALACYDTGKIFKKLRLA